MAEEQLRKALALMRQGEKKQSLQIVQSVLKQDRDNVNAWWLAANLFSDEPERQKKALGRVLAINPLHKGALKMMEALERGESAGYQPKAERQKSKPAEQVMTTQEIEFDWSKLEARDARKKKQGQGMQQNQAARIATFAMVGFVFVLAIFAVIFMVLPSFQSSPEKTVLNFMDAFGRLDWDTMRDLTCEQYRADITTIENSFGSMTGGTNMEDMKIDMKNLTADLVSIQGDTAKVKVGGEFSISTKGMSMSFNIDELIASSGVSQDTSVTVIKENGSWRVCEA